MSEKFPSFSRYLNDGIFIVNLGADTELHWHCIDITHIYYSDEQITDIRRGLTSLRPQVMEGLSTRGEARLWWMAACPRLGSRCFSRLEAAELEAEPEDTEDLVLAGELLERLCACVEMTWSTPG